MSNLVLKAKTALAGEDGGPNVETIVGISVALVVATALIALGTAMATWIGGAQTKVEGLKTS